MSYGGIDVKRTVAIAALATLVAGCTSLGVPDHFNGVRGEGPLVDETREVQPFTAIEAGGGIHLEVTVGATQSVRLEAQENILDILLTDIEGGTLVIGSRDSYSTSRQITATISMESLDGLELSGGAVGEVQGVDADALDLTVSGGAELTVAGVAAELRLDDTGGAKAHLNGLQIGDARITCSGGASAELNVSGTLRGEASGGAAVRVNDDATLDVDVSGGASLE
jgi:hypothetical protein